MFSGIIECTAPVLAAGAREGSLSLRLATGFPDLDLGESVAVNGVCLTVTERDAAGEALFFVGPETLARSNLGALTTGGLVNLERSATLSSRLSGHLVQGHVDGLARLSGQSEDGGTWRLRFTVPEDLSRYCVEKGSIALNGVSLTLNAVEAAGQGESDLHVAIIPHTWEHTNLHRLTPGDAVNVEVDVMAKYVERLCQPYQRP
ncbi:riboflavin synthase subunit alpha [Altererythrobacter sp. B11]|uniref:riboflavin synthase n=1 Tax=Altererythrobacter sp. B11 TaxID=2060312 RepID=UPI000DC6DBBC|nr:riboflavin synthase [Altererythrobacter sp. B11]BBC71975.1 riboflavin synthase subunit alpha [Altererythrobacter sp. B11]